MPETQIITEFSISAIESLENYFRNAGSSLIRAAFAHTYFVHPDKVREKLPSFTIGLASVESTIQDSLRGAFLLGLEMVVVSGWTTTNMPRVPGSNIREPGSPGAPAMGYDTYGDIPGTLMHLPQAGTSAICPSGPACLLRDSTAIPIWNQQFAKHRGTCTSVTPPFAIRPILWRTQVSILSLYSKDSHFGSCVGNLLNAQHAPRRPNRRIPS